MRCVTQDEDGGPEVLRIGEQPDLEPSAGEVLIEVAAAGVNRADLQQRIGVYPPPPGASEIIGLECSGTIAGLGAGVDGWSVGDECVALLTGGGYAEQVVVPVGQVVRPPAGVDLVTAGGLIEVAATVLSNLDLARLRDGENLLVHGGAGGIGSFAIPYAATLGATVIATAGTPEKLDYCRSIGADHAISYHQDWPAQLNEITGGRGADVILDIIGAKYLADNVRSLASDGRLMVIGLQGGRRAELDLGVLLGKRGLVYSGTLRRRPAEQKATICRAVADRVWPLYAAGQLTAPPLTRFPLDQAAEAHRQLESGANIGKIVLVP